jgi:hypothetical protein
MAAFVKAEKKVWIGKLLSKLIKEAKDLRMLVAYASCYVET